LVGSRAIAASLLFLVFPAARADQTADLRFGLPEGAPDVAVTFDAASVVLDLPRGAQLPLDLRGIGAGLLEDAEAQPLDGGGVRLVLRLGASVVQRVEVAQGVLVVRVAKRVRVGTEPAAAGSYRLGIDDRIQISVNGRPELTQQVAVGPAGTVMAPLAGEIPAEGLTTSELAEALTDRLARDFLVDPKVDVQVVEYRSQWVLVSGAVLVPGRVALRGRLELKQVIADAGGFAQTAGSQIVISRGAERSGEAERITIDREEFERGVAAFVVQHGDLITVREAEFCHVLGEVRVPQQVRVEKGLTLFRALANVGGLTEFANRKEIQILRVDGAVESYDLQKIQKGEAEDPPVRGGDRIYVKRRFL
jgi:polysaccharide export outer membrane protein